MALITKCSIDEIRLTHLVVEHNLYGLPHPTHIVAKFQFLAKGEQVGEVNLTGHELSDLSKDENFLDTITGVVSSIEEAFAAQVEVEEETSTM